MNGNALSSIFLARTRSSPEQSARTQLPNNTGSPFERLSGNTRYSSNIVLGSNINGSPLGETFTTPPTPFAESALNSANYQARLKEPIWNLNEPPPQTIWPQAAASTSSTTARYAQVGTSVAKTASGVASAINPVGLAVQVSQQLGEGVASALSSSARGSQSSDYEHNINQAGISTEQSANYLKMAQDVKIQNANTGATIGALFGPIGALVGHYIGQAASNHPTGNFQVNSFEGRVDPAQTSIAASHSTAGQSGESTLQNTV